MTNRQYATRDETFDRWRHHERHMLSAVETPDMSWETYITLLRRAYNAGWSARKQAVDYALDGRGEGK
jgi:hypothetical protein